MLGLSWYAWLNLAGLGVLWAFYCYTHRLHSTMATLQVFNHLTVLSGGLFVVYGARVPPAEDASALLIIPAVYLLAMTAWELATAAYLLWVGPDSQPDEEPTSKVEPPPVSGVLDLDDGTLRSSESQERLARAVVNLTSPGASGRERLQGLGTLLAFDDRYEDGDITLRLAALFFIAAVLGPPCYTALRVF